MSYEDAVCAIMASIAAEEMALSKIIEAESEKIQYALTHTEDIYEVLAVNHSAAYLMEKITDMQIVLKNKLALVVHKPMPLPPKPEPDPPEPDPPEPDPPQPDPPQPDPPIPPVPPPCTTVFKAATKYHWHHNKSLYVEATQPCKPGGHAHTICKCGKLVIFLPQHQEYKIQLNLLLEALAKTHHQVTIHMVFKNANKIVRTESISTTAHRGSFTISQGVTHQASSGGDTLEIMLYSEQSLKVLDGSVSVVG